jgi:RNA polymerase sigma factor (sigma-70 family)
MGGEIDELTLARARRGDPSALSALIRHYQGPVYALVGRLLVGRRGVVDDVAQEAFMRVCRGLPRFEPGGSARLMTWILTVTTRACLNALRDGKRADSRRDTREPPDAAGPGDPEQTAVERERRRRVEAAMGALPEDMRAVLVLRAYHDFDYDEIAAALGIELGTVKSRLGRARVALRAALGDEERHEENPVEDRP